MTIIGMGNPEMGDDGIGIHLLERLRAEIDRGEWSAPCSKTLELVSAGNDPVTAAACMTDGAPTLIIDAVDMKGRPGEYRVFSPMEATLAGGGSACSTHTLSLHEALSIASALGAGRIRILGVQIGEARPGCALSPSLSRIVPEVIERIKEEVELLS